MKLPRFLRTRKATAKAYHYVRDDLLNVQEAKGHFQDMTKLATFHLDPRGRRSGRQETFAHAMQRMGLKPEDVEQSYRFYSFRFGLFGFFLGVAAAMGLWGAIHGNWMLCLGALAPALIFLGQMFNASFRCFQIRRHELLPVSAWWAHRSEWIPGGYSPKTTGGDKSARDNVHRLPARVVRPGDKRKER